MGQRAGGKRLAAPVGVYYDDEVGMVHGPEYIEVTESPESQPEFIGIYDHSGAPLYRVYERPPIGFHHHDNDIGSEA